MNTILKNTTCALSCKILMFVIILQLKAHVVFFKIVFIMDKMNLPNVSSSKITAYKVENDAYTQLSYLDLNISSDAKRKLNLILSNIVRGSKDVITAPYVKEITPDEVLSGLDDIFNNNIDKCNQPLIDLELLNRSKFGPMSLAKDWKERRETLYDSYNTSSSEERSSRTYYVSPRV